MIVARLPKGARVIIYGAGGRGRLLELTLEDRRPDVTVLGYSDTFKRGRYGSSPIFPPEELSGDFDYLIVASAYADKIITDLPEAVLPKVLSYDPVTPPFDPKGIAEGSIAIASTRSSQAMLMNFFNLSMFGPKTQFSVVHLDPVWTLSLWNAHLQGLVAEGRVRHHEAATPDEFEGVYLPEYGNEHVLRFFNSTPLAAVPLCNAGLRSRLRNTMLGLRGRFSRLSVVEFGSICTVTGGNFSTLAIAEMLSSGDSFVTVNLDAGSIQSVQSVCREHSLVDYYCGTSGGFIEERLAGMGTIHFACLLHQPCSEASVASEFEVIERHIPKGGRVLFAHTNRHAALPALEQLLAEKEFETLYRDNAGWMLERQ
ncbi:MULTISPECIES: hypothetical protein [unclassified Pseudodesulfovibrio]|uniref:hypothetical protein n=1 Tax=unclassified Pseudodesulfovibrio TaxID=2661612 RepID=UPI000FEC1919|nr:MULTISPECIES: hypothetical protein [unclassified Pseudodesulfovibrio]MCJ2166235.1 hypothetical protein [Pseudodesulfovibrio sp. S3-i]RWU02267.1 hypothetical protein DWB63_16985 [Pseudodesulfovibrio sp. S3]